MSHCHTQESGKAIRWENACPLASPNNQQIYTHVLHPVQVLQPSTHLIPAYTLLCKGLDMDNWQMDEPLSAWMLFSMVSLSASKSEWNSTSVCYAIMTGVLYRMYMTTLSLLYSTEEERERLCGWRSSCSHFNQDDILEAHGSFEHVAYYHGMLVIPFFSYSWRYG